MRLRKIDRLALSAASKCHHICRNDGIWKNYKEAKDVTEKLVGLDFFKRIEDAHGICYEITDKGKAFLISLNENKPE